ncbi:UDP-3-O-acyl-N-acetylglucosamine deacetylase [Tropicimonas isoalkanivorans]|uniref:UDP-3-O-acyl-N-acetylglucosamine deacetylase n=1 Tax=Tropicimonas isoalkanivorans TaxID=441112 RepID=A0A1I1G4A6_9RHOB|nr:UDP-3-O-acyl-N-acetylglucosamine deacetylase [Tropicimonas isoalkanivorans]SFC06341.1 UDP-3-O-[3-hydroxymyristoyl] N-acetylglucosamine deacetylase [Tropicimonas isoalkanivorans]
MQTTLKTKVTLIGEGLHSGRPARITLMPAPADSGIVFRRTDAVTGSPIVPARWDATEHVPLCTRLVNADGVTVSTVEHVMAALAGLGVHNVRIEVSGPEVPILDGSAAPFVRAVLKAGIQRLYVPLRVLRVCKPVEVREGNAVARLEPAAELRLDFEIDFEDAAIGHQRYSLNMANGAFVRELCDSRTFCRLSDVAYMRAHGLALGGTMDNAVVVEGEKVLSPGGLRHADEPVRHKMLDALGDLSLAGAPILGRYTGIRAGHTLTNRLVRELMATPGAAEWTVSDARMAARLPGVGVRLADLAEVA